MLFKVSSPSAPATSGQKHESLQGPPPVSSCVLTIMVTLSLWELYLCPQQMHDQEGQRLLDTAVIYKLRLTVSKTDFFPMSHFLFGCGDGCGRGLRNEEWFRGANVLVCESELV